MMRCRRSARGRRRARCGSLRCARPAAAAGPSSSARRAARPGRARPHTRRGSCRLARLPLSASLPGWLPPFSALCVHWIDLPSSKLAELARASLRRTLTDTTRVTGIYALRNGRRLISFCCNDYLNLTHHPEVKEAAIAALRMYGVGAGASRLVTGNHPLFAELEGGWRAGRERRPPACSAPATSPISASSRRWRDLRISC